MIVLKIAIGNSSLLSIKAFQIMFPYSANFSLHFLRASPWNDQGMKCSNKVCHIVTHTVDKRENCLEPGVRFARNGTVQFMVK